MTIEELKDEVEKAGYNVKIDWFGFLGAAFQVIIFEKSISIDMVRMSLSLRGWIVKKEKVGRRERGDVWRYFVLEKNKVEVELQPLLFCNVTLNLKRYNLQEGD